MKIKFAVINENVFGYILPNSLNLGILATSQIRGASSSWMNGTYPLPMNGSPSIRPATKQDFEDFRINYEQYDRPEYDLPKD